MFTDVPAGAEPTIVVGDPNAIMALIHGIAILPTTHDMIMKRPQIAKIDSSSRITRDDRRYSTNNRIVDEPSCVERIATNIAAALHLVKHHLGCTRSGMINSYRQHVKAKNPALQLHELVYIKDEKHLRGLRNREINPIQYLGPYRITHVNTPLITVEELDGDKQKIVHWRDVVRWSRTRYHSAKHTQKLVRNNHLAELGSHHYAVAPVLSVSIQNECSCRMSHLFANVNPSVLNQLLSAMPTLTVPPPMLPREQPTFYQSPPPAYLQPYSCPQQ
jgi:hypothetical protein